MNVLDFFLPTDLTRCLVASDNGKLSYYTKMVNGQLRMTSVLSNKAWATTSMWTEFQIRRRFVCLNCDTGNSITGGNVYYYTLEPGFWMPLECEVGWMKYFNANYVTWHGSNMAAPEIKQQVAATPRLPTMFAQFAMARAAEQPQQAAGCDSIDHHWGPYRNTMLAHETMDLGGDIGEVDTITLEYHTNDERHTYAKHPTLGALGLVMWSKPGFPTGVFNMIDHKPCLPLPVCGRSPLI